MDSTTIVVPSSSASSIDSNTGPIVLSSNADSSGNTNSGGGGATTSRKKRPAPSIVSNHGPVALPSDDDDDDSFLDEATIKKRVAAERKRQRREPIYTCWGFGDERTILMVLAAARRETGRVPSPSELIRILKAKEIVLDRPDPTRRVMSSKFHNLKNKFISDISKGGPGNNSRGRDQKIYELCKEVWPPEELRKEGKLI